MQSADPGDQYERQICFVLRVPNLLTLDSALVLHQPLDVTHQKDLMPTARG